MQPMAAPARYLFSPPATTYLSFCVGEWRRMSETISQHPAVSQFFLNYSRAQCYRSLRGNLQRSGSVQSRKNHTETRCEGFSQRRHLVLKYLSISPFKYQLPPKHSQGEPQNKQKRVKRLKRTQRTDSMLERHLNNHQCPHRRGPCTICSAGSHKHRDTLLGTTAIF